MICEGQISQQRRNTSQGISFVGMIHTVYGRVWQVCSMLQHHHQMSWVNSTQGLSSSITSAERTFINAPTIATMPTAHPGPGCRQIVRTAVIRNLTRLCPGPFPTFHVHTRLCFHTLVKLVPQVCQQHNHNGLDHWQEQDCPQERGGQPFTGEVGEQPVTWSHGKTKELVVDYYLRRLWKFSPASSIPSDKAQRQHPNWMVIFLAWKLQCSQLSNTKDPKNRSEDQWIWAARTFMRITAWKKHSNHLGPQLPPK